MPSSDNIYKPDILYKKILGLKFRFWIRWNKPALIKINADSE